MSAKRSSATRREAAVPEYSLSLDDLEALGDKLDTGRAHGRGGAFLCAVADLAAKAAVDGSEVGGFDFSGGFSLAPFPSTNLRAGLGEVVPATRRASRPRRNDREAKSIILVGG